MFRNLTRTSTWLTRTIALTVVGGCLGAAAGGLAGLLGGAVFGLIHNEYGVALYVGLWGAQSGAIAGMLTGFCGTLFGGPFVAEDLPLSESERESFSSAMVSGRYSKRKIYSKRRTRQIWIQPRTLRPN
jgi:hypothetical protein